MKFEFKDLETLKDETKIRYFKQDIEAKILISLLEDEANTADRKYMLETIKFDILDKNISIMHVRMTDETLDKIADVYEKARIELEKIIEEAEPKE